MTAATFRGHRPSGKSSYPVVLVAGAEKTGKSYLVAEFSGSDLIGETFWIEFGEHTAEQYGGVPGARYIIGDYDGTFNDMCRRVREAVQEPLRDGKPNCIVIDSVSVIWETLSTEAQQIANRRKKVNDVDAESKITSDVWNIVTDRWKKLLRILKSHNGPVILVARLDVVAVMDAAGQPTKEKTQKVKAQKALPYDVDVIVQIPEYRKFQLTGVRSLVLQMPPGEKIDLPSDFTLDGLMRNMGLAELELVPRTIVEPVPSADDAMAGTGQQRPAQRQRPQAPADDEWTNAGPVPQSGPPSPLMPLADPDLLDQIAGGLRAVRNLTDDTAMLIAVSAMANRPITNATQLTKSEATSILETLRAEQHAAQQVRKMHALFKQRDIGDHDGRTAFAARIVGHQVATTTDLTADEVQQVNKALNTGEMPAPRTDAFADLDAVIANVNDPQAMADAAAAITEEFAAGRINTNAADLLRERLNARTPQKVAA